MVGGGGGTAEFGVKVSVEETDPSQDKYISVQLVASIGAPPHKLLSIIFNWEGSALGPFLHFSCLFTPRNYLARIEKWY